MNYMNYLAVLVTAVVGFMFGWLWYSPLFGKIYMAEMKVTPADMETCKSGMGAKMAAGFFFTLLSTFGLALLVGARGSHGGAVPGAEFGAMIGVLIVGARMLNGVMWEKEKRPCRLTAINFGHEVALFALQGAILNAWQS